MWSWGGTQAAHGARPLARGEPAKQSAIPAPHRTTTMIVYEIQIRSADGWTNDAELLGHGCTQDDNRWPSEAAALAAVDELVAVGFDRDELRVVLA